MCLFRFIGELYNLDMLIPRIMHDCIRKLLSSNPSDWSDPNLEGLCRLLTTVGQNLDIETKKRLSKGPVQKPICDMSYHIKQMIKLVNEEKTSSRVRFLLQDVIDLSKKGWK